METSIRCMLTKKKIIIYHKKKYFGKELSYGLQLYCSIITMRLSSICVTKWKAGLFSRKYLCGRIYKMTAESKTSSLAFLQRQRKTAALASTQIMSGCLGSLWCLHEQLAIEAGPVPNGKFQSASLPSMCSPFHHPFQPEPAQCKSVWIVIQLTF